VRQLLEDAKVLAEVHIGDGDELGVIARRLRKEIERPQPIKVVLKEFLRIAGKDPDVVGIPVYYAEWPNKVSPETDK
jgi:hypothetical protein